MTESVDEQLRELQNLRLPDLQARFAEVVGESTRSPNKRYLLRRIAEALEAQQGELTAGDAIRNEPGEECEGGTHTEHVEDPEPKLAEDIPASTTTAEPVDAEASKVKLSKLSVPELQERYRETVGRDTRSTSAAYLQWKIRQAEKGRIRVGPVRRRDPEAVGGFKVLPLRMHADVVARLDEARVRLGLKSRMELIRRALHSYLAKSGEHDVAALLAGTPPADSD